MKHSLTIQNLIQTTNIYKLVQRDAPKTLLLVSLFISTIAYTQRTPPLPHLPGNGGTVVPLACNTDVSICTPGVAGPFGFQQTAPSSFHQGCLNQAPGNHEYGFILLNITQAGNLNLLVDGNSNSGYIDVAVFNIPPGQAPCTAIQNSSNLLVCNYASQDGGCVQFGNAFGCGSSVQTPNVAAGSQVMVVVQDWSNMSNTFTLQLGPPPGAQTGPPDATISPRDPFCVNTTSAILMYAHDMGGTWSGPGVSPNGAFNPLTAGIGTHTVSYSIGQPPCQSTDTEQITVVAQPITSFTTNSPCEGGTLEFYPQQPIPSDAIYHWSGPNGWTFIGPNPSIPAITAAMSGTYSMYMESGGCVSPTVTNTITIGTIAPAPAISSNSPVCLNTTIELYGPTASNTQYFWSGPNGWTSNVQSPTITPATPTNMGSYSLYVVADGTCTSAVSTMTISPNTAIKPNITQVGPICHDVTATAALTADVAGGIWNGNGVDAANAVFDPVAAGSGSHDIIYVTLLPCPAADTMTILVGQAIDIQGVSIPTSCPTSSDGSVNIVTQGGIGTPTYLWSNGQQGQNLINAEAGSYTLTITDQLGCEHQSNFNITSGNSLNLTVTPQDITCSGNNGSITINHSGGSAPFTYLVNGNPYSQNPISNLTAGTYNVNVSDSKGCDTSFVTSITAPFALFADSTTQQMMLGDYTHLNPTIGGGNGNLTLSWHPSHNLNCDDCLSPLAWPTKPTTYYLSVTDGLGCSIVSTVFVNVYHDGPFIPNAFTPGTGNDELNNVWKVSDYGIKNFHAMIFDRWGSKIFESDDIYEGWDGKRKNGSFYESTMYVYKLEINYIDGTEKTLLGHITLLR